MSFMPVLGKSWVRGACSDAVWIIILKVRAAITRSLRCIGWAAAVLGALAAAGTAAAAEAAVRPAPAGQVQSADAAAAAAARLPAAAPTKSKVILVVGDSLSAEYGLARDTGWVHLLAARLAERGSEYTVVNASISGETSSGGRTRLPQLIAAHHPAVIVLQLGGNDGLRGLPVQTLEANLQAMLEAGRRAGAAVLLVGIRVPPNYGRAYADSFQKVFLSLAQRNGVALVPFLLEGFADQPTLFQADHIHPTREAQARMLENVWPRLAPLLPAGRR
jgi:acyl-CoA thioesterase-1